MGHKVEREMEGKSCYISQHKSTTVFLLQSLWVPYRGGGGTRRPLEGGGLFRTEGACPRIQRGIK